MYSPARLIGIVLDLWKHRISVMVVFTAVTSFLLANDSIDWLKLCGVTMGVFLMAGGSGSLNHWQERNFDALMQRTQNRPIPSGQISPHFALRLAIASIIAGGVILYFCCGTLPALLGLSNVFWYNAVYTPLKRYSAFAIIPGSLIGAIPAFIGWTAANAPLNDIRIWTMALFLFFWQIPHFWILLIKFADDYERAGYASIKRVFNMEHLPWITFPWIMITTIFSLAFPLVGLIQSPLAVWLIILANVLLIVLFVRYLAGKQVVISRRLKNVFVGINLYLLINMLLIAAQKIIPKLL